MRETRSLLILESTLLIFYPVYFLYVSYYLSTNPLKKCYLSANCHSTFTAKSSTVCQVVRKLITLKNDGSNSSGLVYSNNPLARVLNTVTVLWGSAAIHWGLRNWNRMVRLSLREEGGIRGSEVRFSLQHGVLLAHQGQRVLLAHTECSLIKLPLVNNISLHHCCPPPTWYIHTVCPAYTGCSKSLLLWLLLFCMLQHVDFRECSRLQIK